MQDTSSSNYADPTTQISQVTGEWMILQTAANATGLSLATLRRYIKRRTLKSRRIGKTSNAKVEVFITPELLTSPDRLTTEGLEEVLDAEIDNSIEEYDNIDQGDQVDQANRETLEWMRERLDERDDKIDQLSQKLELLNQQLTGASYRNGYLESQHQNLQEQLKLLTMQPDFPPSKSSWWLRFRAWMSGQANELP